MAPDRAVTTGSNRSRRWLRLAVLLLLCLILMFPGGSPKQAVQPFASGRALPSLDVVHAQHDFVDCHFGVGVVTRSLPAESLTTLRSGWYVDWGTDVAPMPPAGVEYVQMLQTSNTGYLPSGAALAAIAAANPGALWLVGNEPDRREWQDDVLPANYAQVYHDAYAAIKQADPSARVVVGGIVQPTPLRMQYLDIVLDTYQALYGERLPTDAWNVHSFILREADCAVHQDCWGAEIPPGIEADAGELYELDDTDDLGVFSARLIDFRRWMCDRGYRDCPLIISEYGTLMPYIFEGFTEERARVFMYGTFDFLHSAQDADLGYPADENRLVQRWLWYSLDDTANYGGALYNGYSMQILPLGQAYADYVGSLGPAVDLVAVDVSQVGTPPLSPGHPVTLTLQARVSNVGNVPTDVPVAVRFYDGGGQQIGAEQTIQAGLVGCAGVAWVEVSWADVPPGGHAIRVVVDAGDALVEADETNNERWGAALVASERVFFPHLGGR